MKDTLRALSWILLSGVLGSSFASAQTSGGVMCGSSVIPGPYSVGDTLRLEFQAGAQRNQDAFLTVFFFLSRNSGASTGIPLGSADVFLPEMGDFCSAESEALRVLNHPSINNCLLPGQWHVIFRAGDDTQSAPITISTPTVTSFSPTQGAEGALVTLTGVGFFGADRVQFGGVDADIWIVDSDTRIRALVPEGADTGEIRVIKSCQQFSSSTDFTVVPLPVIDDFTPKIGLVGSQVLITGRHFTGLSAISFNGAPVTTAEFIDTAILAVVPPGATDGPISIATDPSATATSVEDFKIDPFCASSYLFGDASRIGSVRFGNLEYVNTNTPGCVTYTNNTERVAHVYPGQTELTIQILQDSCDAQNWPKATKLFIDWNRNDMFDPDEEVLAGPLAANPGIYFDTFDVPSEAALGTTRMRVVTAEVSSLDQIQACGFYAGGETQDYTLEVTACAGTRDLPPELWHMISLPCDPGVENTVRDVFGDDLAGDYGSRWGLFAYDATTQQSTLLNPDDPVQPRVGYWLKTLDRGQSIGLSGFNPQAVGVHGQPNAETDIPLVASPDGRANLVGFPYTSAVDWPAVQVVDGGTVLTLDQADPLVAGIRACEMDPPHASCIMSQKFYRWNGGGYDSFNGGTPGAEGRLSPLDALWVKAFKDGIALRIPETPASRSQEPAGGTKRGSGWFMRLIAESGDLRDAGNVLGELAESLDGYDQHDLDELPPARDPYLTIVFPHPDWEDRAGDYTTDYRPLNLDPEGVPTEWQFEVRSSDPTATVTLSWEGPESRLLETVLTDDETGERVTVRPRESYTFTLTGTSRSFTWRVGGGELPPAVLIFEDGFESGTTDAWSQTR
ncbi:MAG: GEVED domain-containing protein [Acidobacteriota bacterium]